MDAIFAARLMMLELAINFALIIANISIHIRARRLLKSADEIYQEALSYLRQTEDMYEQAKRMHHSDRKAH